MLLLVDQETTPDPSKDQLRLSPGELQPPVLHYMEINNCGGTKETEEPKFFNHDLSQPSHHQNLDKKILKEEKKLIAWELLLSLYLEYLQRLWKMFFIKENWMRPSQIFFLMSLSPEEKDTRQNVARQF